MCFTVMYFICFNFSNLSYEIKKLYGFLTTEHLAIFHFSTRLSSEFELNRFIKKYYVYEFSMLLNYC